MRSAVPPYSKLSGEFSVCVCVCDRECVCVCVFVCVCVRERERERERFRGTFLCFEEADLSFLLYLGTGTTQNTHAPRRGI